MKLSSTEEFIAQVDAEMKKAGSSASSGLPVQGGGSGRLPVASPLLGAGGGPPGPSSGPSMPPVKPEVPALGAKPVSGGGGDEGAHLK